LLVLKTVGDATRVKNLQTLRQVSWKGNAPPGDSWVEALAKHPKMIGAAIHDLHPAKCSNGVF